MSAEDAIAALDDGGANTAAEVRQALIAVLARADARNNEFLEYGEPQHEDGDNFSGGALDDSWTETRDAGMVSEVSAGAWRVGSTVRAGSNASMEAEIEKPIILEVGQSVICCVEVLGYPFTTSSDVGVNFGLRNSSGHFVRMWLMKSQSGAERLLLQSNTGGSNTTILDRNLLVAGRRVWLAIKRENTNTWGFWFSLDGRMWVMAATGNNVTLNPDRVAITFGSWNQAAVAGACYFFDIVDTIGAVRTDLFDEGGIRLGSSAEYPGNPIAVYNTGSWNTTELREIGNVLYDPETEQWVACYTGVASGLSKVGLAFSPNGFTDWTESDDNPITGSIQGEDPYLAKNLDGTVYRDAEGRALLFCEAKAPGVHVGIDLWRSEPGTLTGWTRFGTVLDKTGVGWASQDVSSPTVFHDGQKLVMLFEGRAPGQDGQVGVVTSTDDGETWSPIGDPIIVQGAASAWNDEAVVPDDIITKDGVFVLLVHGSPNGTTTWWAGRYSTTDTPDNWDEESFAEMAGNPFHRDTDSVMCWGNDPGRVVRLSADSRRLELVNVYS